MARRVGYALGLASAAAAAPALGAQSTARGIGGGDGIAVWSEARFRGTSANFRTDVPDLERYGLSARVSSFRVADGEVWEGCDRVRFRGSCQTFYGEESDLGKSGWNDRIRSLRRTRGSGGSGGFGGSGGSGGSGGFGGSGGSSNQIALYTGSGFGGSPRVFSGGIANTGMAFVGSARLRGRWEVCGAPNYRGACAVVDGDVARLESDLGLRTIRSARPR